MSFAIISLILGVLLVVMALSASLLRPLPVSTSIIYLIVGVALGSQVSGVLEIEFVTDSNVLERITEVAVLVSLFTAGLKLRPTLDTSVWRLPLRLGSLSMLVTIVGVTLVGTLGLGLSLGAAVLLGAVLAPTDPVLASDVQVSHVEDQDNVRFGLTGEAGLNDGTAFPFVMLGLGLLGVHPLGDGGWRWFAVDLIWAVASGLPSVPSWERPLASLWFIYVAGISTRRDSKSSSRSAWSRSPMDRRSSSTAMVFSPCSLPGTRFGAWKRGPPNKHYSSASPWKCRGTTSSTRQRPKTRLDPPPHLLNTWRAPCSASMSNWSTSPR